MDIARAPLPAPAYRSGAATLVASLPPPVPRSPAYTPRPPEMGRAMANEAQDPKAARVAPRPEPAEPPLISFAEPPDAPTIRRPRATALAPLAEAAPFASSPRVPPSSRGPVQHSDDPPPADGGPEGDFTSSVGR